MTVATLFVQGLAWVLLAPLSRNAQVGRVQGADGRAVVGARLLLFADQQRSYLALPSAAALGPARGPIVGSSGRDGRFRVPARGGLLWARKGGQHALAELRGQAPRLVLSTAARLRIPGGGDVSLQYVAAGARGVALGTWRACDELAVPAARYRVLVRRGLAVSLHEVELREGELRALPRAPEAAAAPCTIRVEDPDRMRVRLAHWPGLDLPLGDADAALRLSTNARSAILELCVAHERSISYSRRWLEAGTTRMHLALPKHETTAFALRDRASRAPIPGAQVEVFAAGSSQHVARARADARGVVELALPDTAGRALVLAPSYAPAVVELGTSREVLLTPAASLTLRVFGEDRRPLRGAELRIQDAAGDLAARRAWTDLTGHATIQALAPGTARVCILRPGIVADPHELVLVAGEQRHRVLAQRAARVFGRVFDETGRPAPGALVTIVEPEDGQRRVVRCAHDGGFALAAFAAGRVLRCSAQLSAGSAKDGEARISTQLEVIAGSGLPVDLHLILEDPPLPRR